MILLGSLDLQIHIRRHGLGEERDPYRLKDNRGASVICFRCGKSALPQEVMVESPNKRARRHSSLNSENWRRIISCDFCSLHWHVDCLDPPMVSLPPLLRKWKCPNHAASSTVRLIYYLILSNVQSHLTIRRQNNVHPSLLAHLLTFLMCYNPIMVILKSLIPNGLPGPKIGFLLMKFLSMEESIESQKE